MDRRARPRTPGWTYGAIRWDNGERSNGIVWDISDGGVALELANDVPTCERLLLGLSYGGIQAGFPLVVVSRDVIDGRPLVHARFDELSEAHRSVLATLIAEWRNGMDARQVWLTSRRNDRASRADMTLPGDVHGTQSRRIAG